PLWLKALRPSALSGRTDYTGPSLSGDGLPPQLLPAPAARAVGPAFLWRLAPSASPTAAVRFADRSPRGPGARLERAGGGTDAPRQAAAARLLGDAARGRRRRRWPAGRERPPGRWPLRPWPHSRRPPAGCAGLPRGLRARLAARAAAAPPPGPAGRGAGSTSSRPWIKQWRGAPPNNVRRPRRLHEQSLQRS
ncbi:unnamed protein product, partial [Prorocentrum cordatum]